MSDKEGGGGGVCDTFAETVCIGFIFGLTKEGAGAVFLIKITAPSPTPARYGGSTAPGSTMLVL